MIITAGGINKKTGEYKEIDTKKWFVDYSWFCNQKFQPIFLKYLNSWVLSNPTCQQKSFIKNILKIKEIASIVKFILPSRE